MKPTAQNLLRSSRQLQLEPTHIYIEQPPFDFTELFLTDAEMNGLSAIPSRQSPVWAPSARWMPTSKRTEFAPLRSTRPLQAMMAAGMAWMSLPACLAQPQEAAPVEQTPAPVEQAPVRPAPTPRAMLKAEPTASSMMREAIRSAALAQGTTSHHARAPHPPVRPAPGIDEGALLLKGQQAMDKGQFKTALGIFKHVLHAHARQIDALFGAALASHELKDTRAADVFLKRALTVQPGHPLANILAGFTDQLGHRYGGARDHYARFLQVETQGDRASEIRAVVASLPQPSGSGAASR